MMNMLAMHRFAAVGRMPVTAAAAAMRLATATAQRTGVRAATTAAKRMQCAQQLRHAAGIQRAFQGPASCKNNSLVCRRPLHTTACTHMSSSTATDAPKEQQERVLLYEAPIARPVRTLKVVSVTSATLTLLFLPASIFIGNPDMSAMAKVALSTTVCCFAGATTGALHWATKSYVCNITVSHEDAEKLKRGEDCSDISLTAETVSFFGGVKQTTFSAADVTYPTDDPAFKSFFVGNQSFFVHGEVVGPNSPLRKVLKQLKTG
ncbi:hypothetical protein PTSG_01153 [Salpingoeca rosetta]|uniref:Transmembrane protein 186 n=1 Tax=Salpingoeca rosetta (strain ATCC 50818 / BSB-021) TaxID=946362 RepID=F2U0Y7_SALR5|nr:uncharacterized protein PTSG_01153 [Salpingoeca rosetta]EGD80561.1 hypothetical protein PTSG_01153 [Salpingoeca rosetta]|eukprot:XP_004997122.1 hypothetical protein PTSG_01153 [Salpingoeca rosetta]